MKALTIYDSLSGNTEKVATRIHNTLDRAGIESGLIKVASEINIDFLDYDIIFIGSPVIDWLPTQTMMNFVMKKLTEYRKSGRIPSSVPLRPGKFGVCFCTYGGPHIGKNEAVPLTKWFRAFLEHLGYLVLDEWHTIGEFHGKIEMSTKGRMGDTRGRPNENDLRDIEIRVKGILSSLAAWLP
jgi:flavodoxin